jgi:hypothetical protein
VPESEIDNILGVYVDESSHLYAFTRSWTVCGCHFWLADVDFSLGELDATVNNAALPKAAVFLSSSEPPTVKPYVVEEEAEIQGFSTHKGRMRGREEANDSYQGKRARLNTGKFCRTKDSSTVPQHSNMGTNLSRAELFHKAYTVFEKDWSTFNNTQQGGPSPFFQFSYIYHLLSTSLPDYSTLWEEFSTRYREMPLDEIMSRIHEAKKHSEVYRYGDKPYEGDIKEKRICATYLLHLEASVASNCGLRRFISDLLSFDLTTTNLGVTSALGLTESPRTCIYRKQVAAAEYEVNMDQVLANKLRVRDDYPELREVLAERVLLAKKQEEQILERQEEEKKGRELEEQAAKEHEEQVKKSWAAVEERKLQKRRDAEAARQAKQQAKAQAKALAKAAEKQLAEEAREKKRAEHLKEKEAQKEATRKAKELAPKKAKEQCPKKKAPPAKVTKQVPSCVHHCIDIPAAAQEAKRKSLIPPHVSQEARSSRVGRHLSRPKKFAQ